MNVFAGVIVRGTGNTYEVDVYFNGRQRPATTEIVTQLEIAEDGVIEPGTWALVVREADGKFFMQVPILG